MADVSLSSFAGEPFPRATSSRSSSTSASPRRPCSTTFTRMSTNRSSVAFPTSDPTGFDWVSELGEIPATDLGDDAEIAVPGEDRRAARVQRGRRGLRVPARVRDWSAHP